MPQALRFKRRMERLQWGLQFLQDSLCTTQMIALSHILLTFFSSVGYLENASKTTFSICTGSAYVDQPVCCWKVVEGLQSATALVAEA